MGNTFVVLSLIFSITIISLFSIPESAFAAVDTLPGGTNIEVSIDTPLDGTSIEFTGTPIDVAVEGLADIGMGIALKDTDVIYILDISGSMNQFSGVDCNGDGIAKPNTGSQLGDDQRIDCAISGISEVDAAAAAAFSSISKTGLGTFAGTNSGGTSTAHDLDLGQTGDQFLISPAFDGDGNSTPDIIDVVSTVTIQGFTSYGAGLQALETILASSTSTNKIVIFMSDGVNNKSPPISDFETTFDGQGVIFNAFAVGEGSQISCDSQSGADNTNNFPAGVLGNLNDVAALTPGGSCANVTDMSTLADLITDSLGATLETLEIDVDSAGKTQIDNSEIEPDLPLMGPAMADYSTTVTSLTAGLHNICVTAMGSTAFGSGDVTECVDVTIFDAPPIVTVPADVSQTTGDPNGTVVTFVTTATDVVDGDIVPNCTHSSGDIFPVGTTTVTCSATDSAANTSADSFFDVIVELDIQGQKLSVIGMLESLKTGDEKSDKKIDKVIKHIVKSTDEKFWADDGNSLDDKKSKKVFDEEKKAVKDLKKIIKNADDSLRDSILHVVNILIDVDRNLSESARAEASVFAGDKKVDTELEKVQEELDKAQEELDKAQEELDKDKPDKALDKFAKAIDKFKKAWEHAQHAIKHATK